jgi:hypothetical protein
VKRFLDAATTAGLDTHVVLVTDPERAAKQRAARGSTQSPSWVRGASTRAINFYRYAAGNRQVNTRHFADTDPLVVLAFLAELIG